MNVIEKVGKIRAWTIDEYDQRTRSVPLLFIQSALDAYANAKVEEAADRFCSVCPILENRKEQCTPCGWRAAILGREDAHKGEEGRG